MNTQWQFNQEAFNKELQNVAAKAAARAQEVEKVGTLTPEEKEERAALLGLAAKVLTVLATKTQGMSDEQIVQAVDDARKAAGIASKAEIEALLARKTSGGKRKSRRHKKRSSKLRKTSKK